MKTYYIHDQWANEWVIKHGETYLVAYKTKTAMLAWFRRHCLEVNGYEIGPRTGINFR